MGFRITVLTAFAVLAYSALTVKVYDLQILRGSYYSAKAASIYKGQGAPLPLRGGIYFTDKDKNAISAAINRDYPTVFSDNREIKDIPEASEQLSAIIKKPAEEIAKIFDKKNAPYTPISKRIGADEEQAIEDAKIPGIHIESEPGRYYPFGSEAAHILGYVSSDPSDQSGLYGVEKFYNEYLQSAASGGQNGNEDSFGGQAIGRDLNLTVDKNIQTEAENILKNLVETYKGTGGSVIVEDPKTGAILAMANEPTFDPNEYAKSDVKNFLNPSVQAIYEPGSIMKLVTMSAAIDTGSVTPDTTYYDSGSVTLNKKTIKNAELKKYGRISMTNVIEHSVNTGAVFAERAMGHEAFHNYLVQFGFNEKTGIDLPGEIKGGLKVLEKNARDVNFATASFGQGISVTPIALANAVSVIANGGTALKPHLKASEDSPLYVGQRIIAEETAKKMQKIMVTAVNTNEIARIKNYNVAGKTGTAQVPDFKRGGYTDDVINTYIGFAPAYDARFVILVKLDKPAGAPQAGVTIVPAFRDLAEFILNYYNIPPDNISK